MASNLQKTFAMQNRKQRAIAAALVIVLLVLAWQVFGFFFSSPASPPTQHKPTSTAGKGAAQTSSGTAAPATATVPQPANLTLDPTQQKYLQLLEEYKLIELQKMIASDKQAIASAQASTAESMTKITQLGGQVNLQALDFDSGSAPANAPAAPEKKAVSDTNYSLEYTGLEDNSWTATLKKDDSTYDVMLGTVLNGKYKVTDINNNEVVLESPDSTLRVSFDGSSVTPIIKKAPPAPVKTTATQGITQTPTLPVNTAPATTVKPKTIPTPKKPIAREETLWQKILSWVTPAAPKPKPAPIIIAPVAVTQQNNVSAVLAPPPPPPVMIAAPKTVMDLNPNHYTIQLAMLASAQEVQSFINHHHLTDQYFTYQENTKTPRFVIIYGSYPSKAEAQQAANQLPSDLLKSGPYPVSIQAAQAKART